MTGTEAHGPFPGPPYFWIGMHEELEGLRTTYNECMTNICEAHRLAVSAARETRDARIHILRRLYEEDKAEIQAANECTDPSCLYHPIPFTTASEHRESGT